MEVLELGCGTGSTAIAHAPYVKEIYTIDFSVKTVEIACTKAAENRVGNVMFSQAGIAQVLSSGQVFDVVMVFNVLHLLENESEVVRRIYKMLKSGGVFVSSTPCIGDSRRLKATVIKMFLSIGAYFGLLPGLNALTGERLLVSMRDAGFEIDCEWRPQEDSALCVIALKK